MTNFEVKKVYKTKPKRIEPECAYRSTLAKAKEAFDALPSTVKQYLKDMQSDVEFGRAMATHIVRMQ